MKNLKAYILFLLTAFIANLSFAQQPVGTANNAEKKVYLLHANTLSFDRLVDSERQVLRGDVQFRQDSIYMYCDSAYFYESTNSMEAFSNVRMEQGDTLKMFCDSLSYDGNAYFAQLFDNVRLIHNNTILTTDYLTYDRLLAEAHYPYNGVIKDPDDHLKSMLGWYYPNTREAIFKDDVELRSYDFSKMENRPAYPDPEDKAQHPRAILYSDTLQYNFNTSDATLLGPSKIVGDTATVISSRGIYNTQTEKSHLYDRSVVLSRGRYVSADTMSYDGLLGIGDCYGNIVIVDTLQSMKLTGDYGHYVDDPQYAFVTGTALAMEFSSKDTLYLHGDTLRAFTIIKPDTIYTVVEDAKLQDTALEQALPDSIKAKLAELGVSDKMVPPGMSVPDSIATSDNLAADSIAAPKDIAITDSLALPNIPAVVDSVIPPLEKPDLAAAKDLGKDILKETSKQDSAKFTIVQDTLRYMLAYHNVRYYRTDIQGVCDSLHFSVKDSLATFVGNPVMWNSNYQITGDTIFAWVSNGGGIRKSEIHNKSFLVQEKDTFTIVENLARKQVKTTLARAYDQISGKDIVCYFDSSRIQQMDVSGNVQVIFYPEESDKSMIGLNQVIGNYLSVWFANQKMDHLRIWPEPVGSLTPLPLVKPDILTLDGFRWMDYLRPTDPQDVFRKITMSEEDKVEAAPLFNSDELNGY